MSDQKIRVLLIDDDAQSCQAIRQALAAGHEPYAVETTDTLESATALLQGVRFDLVLLSLALPDCRGLEALTTVRALAPDVAVVVLTGIEDEQLADQAMAMGAEDSLHKLELAPRLLLRTLRYARERHRARTTALEMQARYNHVINHLTIGVWRSSPANDGRFLEVNPAMLKLFDARTPEELMSRPVVDFYEDVGQRAQIQRRLLAEGAVRDVTVALRSLTGRRFWASVSAMVTHDRSGGVYFDGFMEDITERQRLEHELRCRDRLAVIGQTMADVAHSMKNLDNTLGGAVSLLHRATRAGDWKGIQDGLDLLGRCTARLHMLLMNMLDYSRPRQRGTEWVRIGQVFQEVEYFLRERALSQGVAIRTEIAADLDLVQTDCERLFHALQNLACNAMESMPEGGELTMTARRRRDRPLMRMRPFMQHPNLATQDELLEIAVSDTGCGIEADDPHVLFDPLYSTKGSRGTGLGLHMVYKFVEDHWGGIVVESRPGQGSCFRLFFPMIEADGTGRSTEESAAGDGAQQRTSGRTSADAEHGRRTSSVRAQL